MIKKQRELIQGSKYVPILGTEIKADLAMLLCFGCPNFTEAESTENWLRATLAALHCREEAN